MKHGCESFVAGVATLAFAIVTASCARDQTAPSAPTPLPTRQSPTPPPTRAWTIVGTLRAVNGGPLPGAAIFAWTVGYALGSQVASTAADGSFRVDRFADDAIVVRAQGHDDVSWIVPRTAALDDTLRVALKMQPTLQVSVGSTVSTVLTADDLTYRGAQGDMDGWPFWSGDYECAPCKFIHVWGTQAGATFRLSWSGTTTPLTVWIGDVYGVPSIIHRVDPTESELTVTVPGDGQLNRFNTLMIGVDQKTDSGRTLNGTASIRVSLGS